MESFKEICHEAKEDNISHPSQYFDLKKLMGNADLWKDIR